MSERRRSALKRKNMQKKGLIRGVSAALTLTILAGSVYCKDIWKEPPVWAWASSELESQKKANDAKIAEMQNKLDEIGKDQTEAEEYQNTLTEKIDLQEENITIVDEQLTRIENEIKDTQDEISETETQISDLSAEIEVDLEQFKKRVRAMYISGNDSLASALVGATDFFDFLSKYDMISRIAKHDNDLVNGLKDDITECNDKKEHLEKKKDELNVQLEEQKEVRAELKTAILELQDDFEESVEYSEMLKEKEAHLNDDIADLESANKELEAEDARILAAILEAERKKKESEEAAKKTTTTAVKPVTKPSTTTVTKTPNNTGNGGIQTTPHTQKTVQNQTTVKTTQAPVQTTVQTTTAAPAPAPSTRFGWPCPGFYTLTSGFGPRWGRHHSGIDIAGGGISGAAAVSSLSGTVIYVNSGCSHNYGKSSSCGCGGGYGNYVIVQHSGGYATVYAHLTSVAVSTGQSVSQGQVVGYVGSTGFSTGPHLHYEVRLNGTRVDPEKYLY